MSEVWDLGCAVDLGILAYIVAYEVVHRFDPETECFPPRIWAHLSWLFVCVTMFGLLCGSLVSSPQQVGDQTIDASGCCWGEFLLVHS